MNEDCAVGVLVIVSDSGSGGGGAIESFNFLLLFPQKNELFIFGTSNSTKATKQPKLFYSLKFNFDSSSSIEQSNCLSLTSNFHFVGKYFNKSNRLTISATAAATAKATQNPYHMSTGFTFVMKF